MTVADYANADPAVVKSGRVKKAVANAVEKEGSVLPWFVITVFRFRTSSWLTCCVSVKSLCGLEASQGSVEEVLSSAASVKADALDSSDDLDHEEDGINESKLVRKKKNKRRKGIN